MGGYNEFERVGRIRSQEDTNFGFNSILPTAVVTVSSRKLPVRDELDECGLNCWWRNRDLLLHLYGTLSAALGL
jgi:hypothetical protein